MESRAANSGFGESPAYATHVVSTVVLDIIGGDSRNIFHMNHERVISIYCDDALIWAGAKRYLLNDSWTNVLGWYAVFWCAVLLAYFLNIPKGWQYGIMVFAGIATIGIPVYLLWFVASWMKQTQRAASRAVKVGFDEAGIKIAYGGNDTRIGWPDIIKIRRYPDVWLIFYSRRQFLVLPTDTLSEDIQECIWRWSGK